MLLLFPGTKLVGGGVVGRVNESGPILVVRMLLWLPGKRVVGCGVVGRVKRSALILVVKMLPGDKLVDRGVVG